MTHTHTLPQARLARLAMAFILLAAVLTTAPGASTVAASPAPAAANTAALAPQAGLTCVVYQPAGSVGVDAYIKQDKQDERRGADPELRVRAETGKLYRSLLQFSLTGLPADAVISSATLSLFVQDATGGAVTVNARQVTASWNEAQVTWKARDKAANLLWTAAGGDYGGVVSSTVVDNTKSVWRSWNVTSMAQAWKTNPASNLGLILEAAAAGPKAEKIFTSSDDKVAKQRPKLEVCYTAGLTLTPNNSSDAVAGATRTYAHVVRVGSLTTVVNLSASSSLGWPVRIYKDVNGNGVKDAEDTAINATPSIGPNADYPILVQVDVPETAAPGTVDVTTVTATAQSGGATATATDTTRVGKLISVTPNYDQYATAGSVLFYGHTVVNNGDSRICVNITAASSLGWTVLLWEDTNGNGVHETSNPNEPPVSNPVCLDGGQSYQLVAEVRVPAGAAAGNVDQTSVNAALTTNPATFGAATDLTRVFVNQPPVVDGQYDVDVVNSTLPAGYVNTTFNDPTPVINLAEGQRYLDADFDYVDTFPAVKITKEYSGPDPLYENTEFTFTIRVHNSGFTTIDVLPLQDWYDPDVLDYLGATPAANDNVDDGVLNWNDLTVSFGRDLAPGKTFEVTLRFRAVTPTAASALLSAAATVEGAALSAAAAPAAEPVVDGRLDANYNFLKYFPNSPNKDPECVGRIGDRVFYDLNGDGLPDNDANDPGLNGVTVRLYKGACAANGALLTSQVTAGNGGYLFNWLPADTYCVRVDSTTLPPGVTLTTANQPLTVNLANDQAFLTADFGYRAACTGGTADLATVSGARDVGGKTAQPASDDACATIRPGLVTIGDRVWLDANANGIQDAGEVGLAAVQVELFDSSGASLASTTTDANGIYGFTGLPAGSYYLQFIAPDGYIFSPQNRGSDPARDSDAHEIMGNTDPFTLAPGQTDLTRDAGLYPAASLGDTVWYDRNGNGIQDQDEPGVAGVTVNLYTAAGAPVGKPVVTNAAGKYLFSDLGVGDYCVEFVLPQGTAFTLPDQGGDDAADSDPDPLTGKACITLAPGENNRDVDAGLVPFGAIGDFVWYDADGDGIQDVGEPGIPNVTLNLIRDGVVIASTVTDADGGYIFPNLPPGTYTVDVTDAYGKLAGLTHIVANQSLPEPYTVNLGPAEINKDVDFGYVREPEAGKAIIGDTVWYDANGDRFQQPGEPGIPGIQVCATPAAGGAAICATTDANGRYRIEVPAGAYNVAPTNPPSGYTATTPVPHPVTVAAGQQYLDADFGYRSPNLGRIGNLVFLDNNKNGVFDAGDRAFPGVSVDLIRDTNGNRIWDAGEPIIATVTTGSVLDGNNGNYLFTGLPSGNYLVHVSDTNAVLTDYTKTPLGTPGADNNNQADPYAISLPVGGSDLTADFGYAAAGSGFGDPIGAIGNQVWIETDGDGLFDPLHGDFGQPGVTVELYKDNVPYLTTTTGPSGRYAFLRLPDGNYQVLVSDLADVLAGYVKTTLGPDAGQDNNNQAEPYAIALPLNGVNWTADFGYIRPAAIGDYIWYDSDGDGIQDVFEPGLGNVTVRLYQDNGDGILQVGVDKVIGDTTTGADGGYLFADLTPGVYFVDVTDTQGMLGGLRHTTGAQSKPDPFGPVTLAAGQTYRDADFGYVEQLAPGNAAIGDTVWYDGDDDGLRDPGEPGIAGIQVCATPLAGGAALCDVTNASGLYLIEVPAGTYTVAPVNPPAGFTATTPVPHGPVTVGPGENYLNADFGYDAPALGAIGGTVWRDTDRDGLLDSGEPRFPGVSVDLIADDGDGVREPGEPVIATVTTDQDGNYLFQGLPAGNYLVIVSDTQNVLNDFMPTALGPNPGNDNNNQEQPYAVTLPAGAANTTADFGYIPVRTDGALGIIGNQVWYESDGNGRYDPTTGDLGIAGVTVALYRSGTLYATTTTGAGGDYVFTSLPSGNYTVQVTDSAGVLASYVLTVLGPNPGADNNHQAQPYAIALATAGINMTADFGYTRPGAIGDFVWYDTNKNGVQDVGEPGIANVTLDLYRGGVKIASTTTDADGGYLFPGLQPGSYTVDVTDANSRLTGMTHIVANQSLTDPTAVIRLGAGEVYKDADFGYVKIPLTGKAIIGDTVWYDASGDGIQQPGEPGIPGIQVCATPTGGGAAICATTDANGRYRIEVPAGSYTVAPTNPPDNYTVTTTTPHPVAVAAGQTYLDADFGYDSDTLLGRIGNLVFLDQNRNGRYDAGDSPLSGVSVSLIRDANNNGIWDGGEPIIATVTTVGGLDADTGNYLFPGVSAGRYLVHVSDTNAVLTDYIKAPLGTPNTDNHNQADPYAVNLTAGGAILRADFGYFRADRPDVGVIGNQVWIEADKNGQFNPTGSDFGQAGVTVELYRNGQQYDITVTGASGDYSFVGLPAGVYTVTVSDDFSVLAAHILTVPGPNQGSDNNNQAQPYTVALPTGGYNLTADFGYTAPKSSIGDTVFYDDDRSGAQNGSETGIEGVKVQLYAQNITGACDQLLATQVTDVDGKYLFTDLAPGNYCVVVPENNDNPSLADFTRTAGLNPHKVSLAPNQNYLAADFGYAGRGPILGIVFYDWDQNGARNIDEEGIPNVQVCLYADLNKDGVKDSDTPLACTTTGPLGDFAFQAQLPGTYLVEQTQPGGLSSTTPNMITAVLQLTRGLGFSGDNNFGELLRVRLGDFAYLDLNGNSKPDPGEPGLQGVPIRITGTNIIGEAVDFTVTTVEGLYYGAGLLPGSYTATAPTATGGYVLSTSPVRSTILTVSFTEDLTLDFGYVTPTGVGVDAFTAASAEGKVVLSWHIIGAASNGFRVLRADNVKGLDMALISGEAPVLGDDNGLFQYTDETATVGLTYWYWLENVDDNSRFGPVSVTVEAGKPTYRVLLPLVQR